MLEALNLPEHGSEVWRVIRARWIPLVGEDIILTELFMLQGRESQPTRQTATLRGRKAVLVMAINEGPHPLVVLEYFRPSISIEINSRDIHSQ